MERKKASPAVLMSAVTAAALLTAGAAFAQSSSTQNQSSPAMQHEHAANAQSPAAARTELQKQLQQAGFRNIDILATGYVLQATSPSGELVTVSAHPQATGSGGSSSGSTGSNSGSSTQNASSSQTKLRQALEQSGFHNVHVVDRAYVAQAEAPDGNLTIMALNLPTEPPAASGSSSPPAGTAGSRSTEHGTTGSSTSK